MIREATDGDLDEIEKLELTLFPEDAWTKSSFYNEIHANPFSTIYVMDEEGIRGYVILWIMYEQAEIANIGVRRDSQNKGIGMELLQYCIKQAVRHGCENISLEVRKSNDKAIHLYEKAGFININIRKKYYENGEDAYLMLKPLGGIVNDNAAGN